MEENDKSPLKKVKKLANVYNLLAVVFLLLIVIWLMNPLQKMASFLIIKHPVSQADVGIILSGSYGDRVQKGVALFKENKVRRLLMTGGPRFNKSEAEFMKDYAVALGVPEDKVSIETNARSTYENAVNTKEMIDKWGVKSIIIITSDYHTKRSYLVFRNVYKKGSYTLQIASGEASINSKDWLRNHEMSEKVLTEWAKLVIYKIKGYI